jgi:hypothetical protein
LKINPLDEWSQWCSGDSWMGSGAYVLQRLATGEQQYFALVGPLTWIDLGDGIDTGDYSFSLCQQGGYWNPCSWQSLDTREGTYFRQITWRWLYLKDVPTSWWQQIPCRSWTSSLCWSDTPKEFRFCSKVVYMGEGTSEVQFCGVITNFK